MSARANHSKARQRPLRLRAWWLMRELAVFGLADLLLTVADGSERAAADNLQRYVRALERHGVLARCPKRAAHTWMLCRDLGPVAPVWRRAADAVWDGNARQILARH